MCWREWVSVGFIGLGFTDFQLAISYWVQISFLRLSETVEEPFRLRYKPLEFKQDWLIDWWFTNFHLFLEHVAVNNLLASVALIAKLGLSVLNSILEITIIVAFGGSSFIWIPRFVMLSATCLGDNLLRSFVPMWWTVYDVYILIYIITTGE